MVDGVFCIVQVRSAEGVVGTHTNSSSVICGPRCVSVPTVHSTHLVDLLTNLGRISQY